VWAFEPFDGRAVFELNGSPRELWVTDGTAAGTRSMGRILGSSRTLDSYPDGAFLNGSYIFPGYDYTSEGEYGDPIGQELFKLDPAGEVTLLADIYPGRFTSNISEMVRLGNWLIFVASDDTGRFLWRTDGETVEKIAPITLEDPHTFPNLVVVGSQLAVAHPDSTAAQFFDLSTIVAPIGPTQETAYLRDGTLRVLGSNGDDVISLYRKTDDPSRVVLSLNGVRRSYPLAEISRIVIYGFGGDDAIALNELRGTLPIRTYFWGGAGDDTLYSGTGSDRVYGGDGSDDMNGGRSGDVLFGGAGDDSIQGGLGDDLIRGGEGRDRIDGGAGGDVLFGQAVFDVFFSRRPSDGESVADEVLAD
jgi:hypothetical protein